MKPQNNEFLNNLLSKYSEFEGIIHGDKESGSTKKKIKAQPEEHGAAPEMIAYGVQQKALNILAEISSIVSARSEGKKHQGKEGEERMSRVISKFLKRYPKAQDVYREELGLRGKMKIAKTVPTMNDFLDEIGVSVGEILSQFWIKELLCEREALEKVGIVERKIGDEMVWCFDEVKGMHHWTEVEGKNLASFPNSTLNKVKGIGDKKGIILNTQELAKLCKIFGIRFATEEDYLTLYRKQLSFLGQTLAEVGIFEREIDGEMVWCFDEVKGMYHGLEIEGKHLKGFPSATFNKAKGIGDKKKTD